MLVFCLAWSSTESDLWQPRNMPSHDITFGLVNMCDTSRVAKMIVTWNPGFWKLWCYLRPLGAINTICVKSIRGYPYRMMQFVLKIKQKSNCNLQHMPGKYIRFHYETSIKWLPLQFDIKMGIANYFEMIKFPSKSLYTHQSS